jgi:peptide/nickel transport system substrate-binding protein
MWRRFRNWLRFKRTTSGPNLPTDIASDRDLVLSMSTSRIPNTRQLRYLPSLLNQPERRLVRFFSILAVISGLALLGLVLSQRLKSVAATGGTLTEGLVGTVQFINPVLARDQTIDSDLTKLMFPGLMKIGADLKPVPDLAESIVPSDDRKTFTVRLKPDLHWSDGEALTTADVVFTIGLIQDTAFASPARTLFSGVTVSATDDQTVEFRLTDAQANFPYALTTGLLPRHSWADVEANPSAMPLAELNVKPISSGPFKFQSVTKDHSGIIKAVSFTRNKFYSGPAPYLNRLVVKFYSDDNSALGALKNDSIDMLGGVDVIDVPRLSHKITKTSIPINQLTAVFFSQRTNAALKVKEVRQALNLAVDRYSIIRDIYHNQAVAIGSPVLKGYPGYDPNIMITGFNLDQARDRLEQAGWKLNDQGVRQKGSQSLTFSLGLPDDQTYLDLANQLIKNWQAIGAKVELKKYDPATIQRDVIRSRSYDALLYGQIYDASGDLYPFWHSSQQRDPGYNLAVFYNRQLDNDLKNARSTISYDKLVADYIDFQRIMANEQPAIFLAQQVDTIAHRSSVHGLAVDRLVSASDRYTNIASWYVKTKLAWH